MAKGAMLGPRHARCSIGSFYPCAVGPTPDFFVRDRLILGISPVGFGVSNLVLSCLHRWNTRGTTYYLAGNTQSYNLACCHRQGSIRMPVCALISAIEAPPAIA